MCDEEKRIQTAGRNVIAWFEMPIRRLDQAQTFYHDVFGFNIVNQAIGGRNYSFIKDSDPTVNDIYGALVEYLPTEQFPSCAVPSFRAMNQTDYNDLLNKVVCNGGQIITQCTHTILGWVAKCKDNQSNVFMIHPIIHIAQPYDTSTPCPENS